MRILKKAKFVTVLILILAASPVKAKDLREYVSGKHWPAVKKVAPGESVGVAPADAIMLFDGKDLSKWDGAEKWSVKDGAAVASQSHIFSKKAFGSCQLHVEWMVPSEAKGKGQERGNSGVFLMGLYEVQILESSENETYPDGQAGAIYKQHPPLVNASRKQGEWQSFDIIFAAPRFEEKGNVQKPAYITVFHNGVLVQDHAEVEGATSYYEAPKYAPHADKLPLKLQYHDNHVRFRNIWIREL